MPFKKSIKTFIKSIGKIKSMIGGGIVLLAGLCTIHPPTTTVLMNTLRNIWDFAFNNWLYILIFIVVFLLIIMHIVIIKRRPERIKKEEGPDKQIVIYAFEMSKIFWVVKYPEREFKRIRKKKIKLIHKK